MLTKSKQIEKFYMIFLLVLFGLISILAILNISTTTQLREITIKQNFSGKALLTNQIIQYNFTQNISNKSNISFVSEPEIKDVSIKFGQNSIQLIVNEILENSQKYNIKLQGDLLDNFGRKINFDSSFQFETQGNDFIFKKINENNEVIFLSNTNNFILDKIYQTTEVKKYSATDAYIALIEKLPTGFEKLVVIDYAGKVLFEDKTQNKLYGNVKISSDSKYLMYSSQDAVYLEFLIPKSSNILHILDIGSEFKNIELSERIKSEIMDFYFTSDNRTILIKKSDGNYYLADFLDRERGETLIGRFTSFGGFDLQNSKIVFTSYDPLVTYSSFPFISIFKSNRQIINITDGSQYVTNPVFYKDSVIFSRQYKDIPGSRGLMEVVEYDLINEKIYKLAKFEGLSLELSKISQDHKILSLESYSPNSLSDMDKLRLYSNETKPYRADIVFFDLNSKEHIYTIFSAQELIWL
jgi:hypothetical protein